MQPDKFENFQILVVDDERLIQKLVSDVLTSLGFTNIHVANSGKKAIELLSQFKFDFMIADWQMEDMDGMEIVRFIRNAPNSTNRKIPIIMLTANTAAAHVKTAIAAGINAYVIKPFSAEQLTKRIRSVIETPVNFVIAPTYAGPDRRRVTVPPPGKAERRKNPKK